MHMVRMYRVALGIAAGWVFASGAQDYTLSPLESAGDLAPVEMTVQAPSLPPAASDEPEPVRAAVEAYREDRPEDAIRLLEPYLNEDPTSITGWRTLGSAWWKSGRPDRAEEVWADLARMGIGRGEPHRWLGELLLARDQPAQAMEHLRLALRRGGEQPEVRYLYTRAARWSGHLDEAEASAKTLAGMDDRFDTDRELAAVLFADRRYPAAAPLWKRIAERNPDDLQARIRDIACRAYLTLDPLVTLEAQRFLAEHPDSIDAHTLLLDLTLSGGRPAEALRHYRSLIAGTDDPRRRASHMLRMVNLIEQHAPDDPETFRIAEAQERVEAYLAEHPGHVDVRLMLADLHLQYGDADRARHILMDVLSNVSPDNLRAARGLFEVEILRKDFEAAAAALEHVARFNRKDPYLHYLRVRYHLARSDFASALREADALEQRGHAGAVAVLLFHGLGETDGTPVPSVRRMREYLETFRRHGYAFIPASRLHGHLVARRARPEDWRTRAPNAVACVTFDDARRDAMRLGAGLSQELRIPFSMHVPTGYIDARHPFFSGWDELRDIAGRSRWEFGSHAHIGHEPARTSPDGDPVHPLGNRLWMPEADRIETMEEYLERLDHEYRHSARRIREELKILPAFIAYPFGDLGQLGASNVPGAAQTNLTVAARYYRLGFIQSAFGHAVEGDDPLLFQRMEPRRDESGEAFFARVRAAHPVFLARRLRAEICALADRRREAVRMVELLDRDGYPAGPLRELKQYVQTRLRRTLWDLDAPSPMPEPPPADEADVPADDVRGPRPALEAGDRRPEPPRRRLSEEPWIRDGAW
jgi:tetratricopeptide (TPR) repeat protein